ncbi:hypothetical protein KC324_g4953 [Hortaea werneckii]|nr:hypothetical protein KC324_g4953 [Hortaea werneckii]
MRETISELQRLLSGVDASAGAKAFGNRLPSTLEMLKEYAEKLVEHGRKQEALGFAEEKLYHQSSIFEKCISEIGQTLPHHFRAGTPEATSTTASCSSKRVTHPDPVLDYLAKRSAVEIFQERIIDLQDEFHEEKANRSLQRDQDIELDLSDEDFEQYYEGLVQNNLAEMEQKRQEMNAAETKCYQLGLDVNIRLKDWAVEESETKLPDSPQSLPASDLQDLLTPTNERIIQWRDEIAAYDLAVRKGQIVSNDYFFLEAYRVSGGLRRIKSEPLFSTRWHVRHRPQAAEMYLGSCNADIR